MKQEKSNIFIIVVFIAMITLPQIVFWIGKDKIDVSTTENRTLAKKPELEFATITKYPTKFDAYYNDHLPFRTQLRKAWVDINNTLLDTTVDTRLVRGKLDWLFYRGNLSIEQAQGIIQYSDVEKQTILNDLQSNANYFKEKGIETFVLVIPNRENVYREYLPDTIPLKNIPSRAEELIQYIRDNSDMNVVYPKEELLAAKQKHQVYRKYDSHWNKVGACIGTIALQKAIDKEFEYDVENIEIEILEQKDKNDLAGFASLQDEKYENVMRVDNFYSEVEYTVNELQNAEEYISNSENDKTVLFIGDSYRGDMKEYFSKLYQKVVYVHRDYYTEELMETVEPDIVIIEAVERFTDLLAKKFF